MAGRAAISDKKDDRAIEFVDHLHQDFVEPAVVSNGCHIAPDAPGFSAQMQAHSVERYRYPEGSAWREPADMARAS